MPGEVPHEQNHDAWNSILDYQRQREREDPTLIPRPAFSHIIEEENWRLANEPNLESCPDCSAPMMDQGSESVCHDCGHKQPIIQATAGAAVLALPEIAGLAGGAAEGGGAAAGAGGGLGGVGSLMNSALGRGVAFQSGKDLVGGGHNEGGGGGSAPAPPAPQADPTVGVVSKKFAAWDQRHAGVLSGIFEALLNAAKNGVNGATNALSTAAQNIDPGTLRSIALNPAHPLNPLSYGDDALMGGIGQAQKQWQQATSSDKGAFGEEEVGIANKNDGTNSTDEASNSGTEGKEEQGDGPEQLKDVDGEHDSQGSHEDGLSMEEQIDPALQDKALKAFHMNLPLVIEFSNSEEPGIDNPILAALDQLLEEAFPGYKDGTDQEHGATDEHPQEKSEAETPDEKSEGADKKDQAKEASVWHFAEFDKEADAMLPPAAVPAGAGGPAMQICPRCGQAHPGGTPCPVADVVAPLTDGAPISGAAPNKVITKWKLAVPSNIPAAVPQQAAGAPAAPSTCPMCGCNHIPGTPCPSYDNTQQPAATGTQPGAPAAAMAPLYSSWEHESRDYEPSAADVRSTMDGPWDAHLQAEEPAAAMAQEETCPTCNTPTAQAYRGTCVGCGTPLGGQHNVFPRSVDYENFDQNQFKNVAPRPGGILASEHEHSQDSDSQDSDWTDASGQPLQEGVDYEMKTAASPIPDRVTIERILPEKLTYIIHSGDVDFRDTITRDQLDLDGAQFQPVDWDNSGEDSVDRFPGEEMPPRPGDDALPQQDDLSGVSTTVSSFEPVSLDNYTGSFDGDQVDDRSWIMDGAASAVEVDPALMAKLAGKDFSPREQREFIDEKGTARNLDRLDLAGTHYIDDDLHTNDTLW